MTFLKVILLSLSTCIILGYFTEIPFKSAVFITFGATALVFSIWAAMKRKWIIVIIGIFTVLSVLWILLQYPNYNFLQFLMIIPLLCYLWTLVKWQQYKYVISVLTVLAFYELSELFRLITT